MSQFRSGELHIEGEGSSFYVRKREAGMFGSDAPLEHHHFPLIIVVNPADQSGNTSANFDVILQKDIDYVEELRLVGVSAGDAASRLIKLESYKEPLLDGVRAYTTRAFAMDKTLPVSPGMSLGDGLLVKSWRDAKGYIPRNLSVQQYNLDGTPFSQTDKSLILYFNVKAVRFQ
jgi:hypothetical protein